MFAFALLAAACGAAPAPTATPLPSPTALPTTTPFPTLASTATAIPTATLVPTPWPTPDAEAPSRRVRLPILMYHYVEPWPVDPNDVRQALTVKPEDFAAQMQYLRDNGFVSVSLYDLLYALALGWPLPARAVVITFDDGYRSLVDYAVPVMQPLGFTGTVFVVTEVMDKGLAQYLTWPQAEALYAQGWKIEPHTKSHQQLAGRDRDFQLYEMLGSVQTVAAHIGVQPRFFNYPAGQYDDLTLQLAREMNLWGGVSTEFGREHTLESLYTLSRVRVDGRGALPGFVNGVTGSLEP